MQKSFRHAMLILGMLALSAMVADAQPRAATKKKGRAKSVLYASYLNARYGYAISYPSTFLRPEPESDNGDGRQFTSNDSSALLTVWGENNVSGTTLRSLYKGQIDAVAPGRVVSYKIIKPQWFVVSWSENGRLFYRKTIARKGGFATFILEYTEGRRGVFDPMVPAIAASFR